MKLGERLQYAGYAAGWAATKRLPERVARGGFETIGELAWRRRGKGVLRLEQNLRRVRPDASAAELRELSLAGMRSYLRYWCEMFRLPVWSRQEIIDRVVVHDEPRFRAAIASGDGVVAVLPHLANWDLAGAWACVTGTPLTTVMERLRPERLYERFVSYRERLGMEVLPASGELNRLGVLADRLRAGSLVCLVGDRDLSSRGVEVSFFGETARMPPGPAVLARRTGATLLPVTLWYDGPAMHIQFAEPIHAGSDRRDAIRTMSQRVADAFAAGIAAHPADWHMLQRVFTADLDPARAESEASA